MTTHTISNTIITGGYNLSPSFDTLSITPTGEISGGSIGVLCSNTATVINRGSIVGSTADGVELKAGGSLTNGSAAVTNALIQSQGVGVYINAAGVTVTNFATISGATAVKLKFASDALVVQAGSTLIGAVQGGGGSLELGSGVGTVSGLGSSFSGFGYYGVSGGATWTLSGTNALAAKTTLTNRGTVLVGGTFTDSGSIANPGVISGASGVSGKAGATAVGLTGGALSKGSLTAGGAVTNTGGAITGGAGGAGAGGGAAVNGSYGVLSNYGSGLITGGVGGTGGAGGTGAGVALLINNGAITGGAGGVGASYSASGGAGGAGARISQYGSGANKGVISGGAGGAGGGAPHTGGTGGVGVYLGSHAVFTNTSQGTITSGAGGADGGVGAIAGVVLAGAATLVNAGTISGGTYSVDITGPGAVLVEEVGGVLNGAVKGGGGTLEVANGVVNVTGLGATGTLSGAEAMTFSHFGAYQVDSASYWTLTGADAIGAGVILTDNGHVFSTGTLALYGTVAGYGTFDIYSGITTIGGSAKLTVANLQFDGGTTRLNTSLTNTGNFSQGVPATLTLGSKDQVLLSGTTVLHGLIDGAGTVTVSYGTINQLSIGGADQLIDTGNVTGGALSIGGLGLMIEAGAKWTVATNSDVLHGSATSNVQVAGTLIANLTAHCSVESPIIDTGLIDVQAGTFNLDDQVTGTGALQVDAGATLTINGSVASTVTANLKAGAAGKVGVFALENQAFFAGTIAFGGAYAAFDITPNAVFTGAIKGFGANDTIDLLGVVATSASINANDQLVIIDQSNGTITPVAMLQMSSQYAGEVFTVHAHTNGYAYSTITMSPGTPPSFKTETISTNHTGGINLNSRYNLLNVTSAGTVNASGRSYGVLSSYDAEIINNGKIIRASRYGVDLQSPTYLINGSASNRSAYIQSNGIGVYARHAFVTVTNFGTIAGGNGVAVEFAFARDRLIVENGSRFVGEARGGGGALELASGTGTITGLGGRGTISGAEALTFSGFGAYQLDGGTAWTLAGTDTVATGVTLASNGALNITGRVTINGELDVTGGATTIAGSGNVASLALDGGTTYLNRSLTIVGDNTFSEYKAATLVLANGVGLSLTGAATVQGLITGAGSVTMANGGTVGSLALSAGASLIVTAGTVTEMGAMSIGGGSASAPSLLVGQKATWIVGYGLDLQHASETAYLEVDGRLIGACVNGNVAAKSEIASPVSIASTGVVEAQAGPLIFNGPVTGNGALQIDAGATLTANVSLASTLKASLAAGTKPAPTIFTLGPDATFSGAITCLGAFDTIAFNVQSSFGGVINGFGAGDTLALGPKVAFTGVIAGFGVGGTIDLTKANATAASINGQDQLVIVSGATTVATLQLTGTYSGATFQISADGSGGTNVSMLTAARQSPPGAASPAPSILALNAAMAGLGAGAGSGIATPAHDQTWRPALLAPRPTLI